jgi:hypothetical protein
MEKNDSFMVVLVIPETLNHLFARSRQLQIEKLSVTSANALLVHA